MTAKTNISLLWGQPTDLLQLGVMHSGWIHYQGERFGPRPGDRDGFKPADVLGVADFATPKAFRTIRPTLIVANAAGWVTRDWAVRYDRMIGNLHVDMHVTTPAVFGYCTAETAAELATFANTYGYEIQDRPCADVARAPGAPHVYVGGRPDPHRGIGWQRTRSDIDTEWAGLNEHALESLYAARQVTIWSDYGSMWSDLADHYHAGLG